MRTQRDGVTLTFYPDGSGPAFHVTRGGRAIGVNERLTARDRRWSTNTHARVTTLRYTRQDAHLVIDGDLGRAFPPQPWARGLLPVVCMNRIFAFHAGASRAVLEFIPPIGWSDAAARATAAATALLLRGWRMGDCVSPPRRAQEILGLLGNMGLRCSAAQWREAIALQRDAIVPTSWRTGWVGRAPLDFADLAAAFEPFVKVPTAALVVPARTPYVRAE